MIEQNHECYVSLEVAKLLKEAGFDWECHKVYKTDVTENLTLFTYMKEEGYRNTSEFIYSAPTLDVAQRWLRQTKGYNILVCHDFKWNKHAWWILQDNNMLCHNLELFNIYEEAQEAGIKKALELILEKEE